MLWRLNAFQLCQKGRQIISGDNKVFDMIYNRIVVLTGIIIDDQFPGLIIVVETLRDQDCRIGKVVHKRFADIEIRNLRRRLPPIPFDFLLNGLVQKCNGLRHMENSKIHFSQLFRCDSVQQV